VDEVAGGDEGAPEPKPATPDAFTQMLRADPRCNVIEPTSSATPPDALSLALANDPRCKVLPPSGKGFVIGGQDPRQRGR